MMSRKLDTLDLFKIKIFWNKGYDVIVSVQDVTNKFLSLDSNYIVEGCSWFKFNKLGLVLGIITLKFYNSVAKELKLKVRKILVVNSYVCAGYRGKTGRGAYSAHPSSSWIGLNYLFPSFFQVNHSFCKL